MMTSPGRRIVPFTILSAVLGVLFLAGGFWVLISSKKESLAPPPVALAVGPIDSKRPESGGSDGPTEEGDFVHAKAFISGAPAKDKNLLLVHFDPYGKDAPYYLYRGKEFHVTPRPNMSKSAIWEFTDAGFLPTLRGNDSSLGLNSRKKLILQKTSSSDDLHAFADPHPSDKESFRVVMKDKDGITKGYLSIKKDEYRNPTLVVDSDRVNSSLFKAMWLDASTFNSSEFTLNNPFSDWVYWNEALRPASDLTKALTVNQATKILEVHDRVPNSPDQKFTIIHFQYSGLEIHHEAADKTKYGIRYTSDNFRLVNDGDEELLTYFNFKALTKEKVEKLKDIDQI